MGNLCNVSILHMIGQYLSQIDCFAIILTGTYNTCTALNITEYPA